MSVTGVILATLANQVLGFSWYGPLFGRAWIRLMKIPAKDMGKMKEQGKKSMFVAVFSTLLVASMLSYVMSLVGVASLFDAVGLSVLIWLGFVATTMLGSVLWERQPVALYGLNVTYQLVSYVMMAAIVFLM